jgi:hypothetical protein
MSAAGSETLTLPGRMLRLLSEGGIRSTAELARRLEVSEGLVGLMMEDLTRRGYLASLGSDCSTGCGSCGLATACGTTGKSAPVLTLTEKGRRFSR